MASVAINAGRVKIISQLNGVALTAPTFIGHGTGAGTAAVTDTILFTESADVRVAGAVTIVTTNFTNDTLQVVSTLTNATAGAETITNAGLADASSAGTFYAKGDFTGQVLNVGDKIQYTIKFILA